MLYDFIVIGSGAAGLSAAIYAGRYMMKTLIIEGDFGGETAKAGVIWNYPGRKSIDGFDLMLTMREQSTDNGAKFADGKVTSIKKSGGCIEVVAGGKTYTGKTLLMAMGAERRHLGLPNEKELTGKGVHYCVTCDGPIYGGKTIVMVGGGDASVKGINLAAEYVKKAYLITREKELNAEPINIEEMKRLGDTIEVYYETQVKEIVATPDGKFDRIILDKPVAGSTELKVDGLFVEIGAVPNRELPAQLGITTDPAGYITVDAGMNTNVPGVFAAGDATHFFGRFKQDITAAAQGAVAATSAYEYLKHTPNVCELHASPEA